MCKCVYQHEKQANNYSAYKAIIISRIKYLENHQAKVGLESVSYSIVKLCFMVLKTCDVTWLSTIGCHTLNVSILFVCFFDQGFSPMSKIKVTLGILSLPTVGLIKTGRIISGLRHFAFFVRRTSI